MRYQPVAGVLAGMAGGTQIFLYCRTMFNIRVTVVTGDLIVCNVVFMDKTEIPIFFNPFSDIMT